MSMMFAWVRLQIEGFMRGRSVFSESEGVVSAPAPPEPTHALPSVNQEALK